MSDTIYALATPPGRSGVAIIRLSGPASLAALRRLTGLAEIHPRQAHYAGFYMPHSQALIDKGLALYFPAPHSFTGEDVVELHAHGSLAVLRELLETLGGLDGMRMADAGEFTRRAFINGKMDLVGAEGLADLIAADTTAQKAQALRQMQGETSAFYEMLRRDTVACLAHLEAYIDFPDEDIPEAILTSLSGEIGALRRRIGEALADDRRGERLREGVHVVILGAPNAGKSSLLNAIAKRDAAIVSARAGTTRDIIEIHMDMGGFPVILADTAGIRDTEDEVEEEGVRRALARADSADIRLVLVESAHWSSIDAVDAATRRWVDADALVIITKCDLRRPEGAAGVHCISARTGEGMESLLTVLEQRIARLFSADSAPLITRARHRTLLEEAHLCLSNALETGPLELMCEELRLAGRAVGKITGKIQVDDVLDVIFRQFCIGK